MHWEEVISGNIYLPLYKGERRETQEIGKKSLECMKYSLK